MNDSFRYGLPLGMVAFACLLLQANWLPESSPWLRWSSVLVPSMAAITYTARLKNKAFFPFRYGFLNAFNILFIATLLEGGLMFLFQDQVVDEVPQEVSSTKWIAYLVFIETMGFMFVGLLSAALAARIFRRKR